MRLPEDAEGVMRGILKRFPLYHAGHTITISTNEDLAPGAVNLGYKTTEGNPDGTTHFTLQFKEDEDTCYIAWIEIEDLYKGTGLGAELYSIAEEMARQCACRRIVMHPSGRTFTGESRRDYVLRRGYRTIEGSVEVEKILSP